MANFSTVVVYLLLGLTNTHAHTNKHDVSQYLLQAAAPKNVEPKRIMDVSWACSLSAITALIIAEYIIE